MTLMPVSNIAVAGLRSASGGAARWIGARGMSAGKRRAVVAHRAGDVEQPAEHRVADRHRDRAAGRAHGDAALQPGGRLQRHAADGVLVEMGLNFEDQGFGLVPFDDERLFELRKRAAPKGDVDDRAANRGHNSAAWGCVRHVPACPR